MVYKGIWGARRTAGGSNTTERLRSSLQLLRDMLRLCTLANYAAERYTSAAVCAKSAAVCANSIRQRGAAAGPQSAARAASGARLGWEAGEQDPCLPSAPEVLSEWVRCAQKHSFMGSSSTGCQSRAISRVN